MTQDNPIQKIKNIVHLFQSIKANIKYKFPSRKLKIIGVTGSDGKTTTTSMIYHILKSNGLKVAYMSTISAMIGDEELDTGLHVTTPEPWDVPRYIRKMVDKGTEYLVLESTSNGLHQNRLWGIKFDSATITNIRMDHLDYHGTWKNYAKAKFLLLKALKVKGLAVLNADDIKSAKWLERHIKELKQSIETVWYKKVHVQGLEEGVDGMKFKYKKVDFHIPVIGAYNLENALAVINICNKYLSLEDIAKAFETFPIPKGRMEVIQREPYTVIIDFAHTPNALEQALKSTLTIMKPESRLISVFGCAGKRDKSRRNMGAVSAKYSDITILTAEDPRDEKLKNINSDIFKTAKEEGGKLVERFVDRVNYQNKLSVEKLNSEINKTFSEDKKPFFAFDEDSVSSREDAIDLALKLAKPSDVVFITGKAHEQSLAFGKEEKEYKWSDHETVNKIISIMKK